MYIQSYNDLKPLFEALHQEVTSLQSNGDAQLEQKVNALCYYIHKNAKALSNDLLNEETHGELYQDIRKDIQTLKIEQNAQTSLIKAIEEVRYRSELLKLEVLAENPDELILWLNKNQTLIKLNKEDFLNMKDFVSLSMNVLDAFDAVKKSLRSPQHFNFILDKTLSKMVASAFRLNSKSAFELREFFKNKETNPRALAHVVNACEIPLSYLELSIESLSLLAPYLQYVDCRDIKFKDGNEAQKFIEKCSGAYQIFINSDEIEKIDKLPAVLKEFNCSECNSLVTLPLLDQLALEKFNCSGCTSLKTLSLSNLPVLEEYYGNGCTSLTTLSLSNLPALKDYYSWECTSLTTLSLSNLPALKRFICRDCTLLTTLFFSNLPALETFNCMGCSRLETIRGVSLPSCTYLHHGDCLRLRQLPQLPNGCTVISYKQD